MMSISSHPTEKYVNDQWTLQARSNPRVLPYPNVALVPLHHRPDLKGSCADLLNQQWRRSLGARIHSLEKSSDDFPACLVLIGSPDGPALGHARLCRVIGHPDSLFVESVVVSTELRGMGYGRRLMEATECYSRGRGFRNLYLTTHDKQDFYAHLGYTLTEPVQNMGSLGTLLPMSMLQSMTTTRTDLTSKRAPHSPPNHPHSPLSATNNSPSLFSSHPLSGSVPPPPPLPSIPPPTASSVDAPSSSTAFGSSNSANTPPPPPPLPSPVHAQASLSVAAPSSAPAFGPSTSANTPPPPPPLPFPAQASLSIAAPSIFSSLNSAPPPPPFPPIAPPPPPPPSLPSAPSVTPSVQDIGATSALQTPYRDFRGEPIYWMKKSI
ncbi:N-alpha-acetyltransferase 80-like [Bombina bombina]|uniref:N-alpha-acetyltransferase 80-like n=1 Tax=Bombina bombina TaxID=8345 RepID=UPI00235A9F06|nr:N-alpha-acetyltransferase 80-like [Bombina bombina]